jgi:hypothetical protein
MSYSEANGIGEFPGPPAQVIAPRRTPRVVFNQVGDSSRLDLLEAAEGPFTVTFYGASPERKHLATYGPFDSHAEAKAFMTGAKGRSAVIRLRSANCVIDQVITSIASAPPAAGSLRYFVISTRMRGGEILDRHAYGFFGSWEEADDFAWNKLSNGLQPGEILEAVTVDPPPS